MADHSDGDGKLVYVQKEGCITMRINRDTAVAAHSGYRNTAVHGGDIYRNAVREDFSVNVNPLGPPDVVTQALQNPEEWAGHYPDPYNENLTAGLRRNLDIPKDISVVWGNGASELISEVVSALRPEEVWSFTPAFTGYRRAAEACGAEMVCVPLARKDDYDVNEAAVRRLQKLLLAAEEDSDPRRLLILTDPGNPTGRRIDPDVFRKLISLAAAHHMRLLVDGCFRFLSGDTDIEETCGLLQGNPQVVYISALTKTFAIPGLRLGYLLTADSAFAGRITQMLPEWNISVAAQRAGEAIMDAEYFPDNYGYLERTRNLLEEEKPKMRAELKRMGMRVFETDANFVLFHVTEKSPGWLWRGLLERGILIRDCCNYDGLTYGDYRVAIRTREKNELLISEIWRVMT